VSEARLPVFRTVTLGIHATPHDYLRALKAAKCAVSEMAADVLSTIEVSPVRTEVNLVVLSVQELGFRVVTPYGAIRKRAGEIGVQVCPAEVGPALRLQYLDQPKSDEHMLRIGMMPIYHKTGGWLFDLLHIPGPRFMGRGLSLGVSDAEPVRVWGEGFGPGAEFVFTSASLSD